MPGRPIERLGGHPFWDWSLELYGKPGMEAALIDLQDRLGLDVNLLLFACWTGATGRGRLSDGQWAQLISGTEDWRRSVVEPLRAVRRYLKGRENAVGLRERLKALELEAESAEQAAIMALAEMPRAATAAAGDQTADIAANLEAYIAAAGCPLTPAVRGTFRALAASACDAPLSRTRKNADHRKSDCPSDDKRIKKG